jgi:hypothetical protein
MNLSAHLAKHCRDVHFGGNWTAVNLKDSLGGLSWQQATKRIGSFNSIAALTFHMNYFVSAVLKVLQGGPLEAHDKFSFNLPQISSQQDWEQLLSKTWADAENFALLVEQLTGQKLWEVFTDEKYGSYYSNIQGIIEHCHYHLGQIVILKKLVLET